MPIFNSVFTFEDILKTDSGDLRKDTGQFKGGLGEVLWKFEWL